MRALLALAASLLLPLAAAGAQPAGRERYLPADIFADRRDADFYNAWLGGALAAIQEPVLLGTPLPHELRRRFRLLATDHDGGGWAVRVDQRRSGGARVRAIEFSGGRSPRIQRAELYEIDRDAVLEMERALDLSGLRRMSAMTPPRASDPAGEICLSFGQFSFELVDRTASRFIMRYACEVTPRLDRLLETLQPLRAR